MAVHQVDLYGKIHKALRRMLSSFISRVGALDWDDVAAVAALKPDWALIQQELHRHHGHEEQHIHSLLARGAPGSVRELEADHSANLSLLEDLNRRFLCLADGAAPADRRAALGDELFQALNLFYARLLGHMHREDVEAQRVLDSTCSQQELAAALGAIVGSIPPAEMLVLAGHMFPAISLPERAEILGGIKASAPPQAYAAMADCVRAAIGETEWAALGARIGA
ncbi:MAG: hemerythrin domain-containing protein [Chthonomonadales bacterium]|nr:hemerythrin domain-containing protein [Chthonomonadales bacterium]